MNKYDLSILIPARNEMFLLEAVNDILKNKRGKTEIIVHLDGAWSDPGLPDHPDLTIIYSPEAIGQRAGTNKACRLSRAKYVMKADAHLTFDEGFDVKLMSAITDDMTIVPMMRNLHAFDWVCIGEVKLASQLYYKQLPEKHNGCGYRFYQGKTPKNCEKCGGNMIRLLLWKAKDSPRSTSFTFDKTLHFQYFNEMKKRPEGQGELTETMSIQGSCFMLTRKKYWELNICDEEFGSWGQQGVEVACKTWFSGGRVMCLQTTWYAHLFRTQGGDFSFPYHQSQKQIDHARKYSRELFEKGTWDKSVDGRNLDWLLKKFYPVPYWHYEKGTQPPSGSPVATQSNSNGEPTKDIIFYTDNQVNSRLAHKVQNQLRSIGLPIVSTSLKPMANFGKNIHIKAERGYITMFRQIIAALEASESDIIYMCEHDVVYHPSHFDFTPPKKDKFYYNINFWKVWKDGLVAHWEANQVSGLIAYRQHLLNYYREKLKEVEKGGFNRSYEPGGRDKSQYEQHFSKYPNIDIRLDTNLTKSHRSPKDFRDKSTCINWKETTLDKIEGWDNLKLTDFYK